MRNPQSVQNFYEEKFKDFKKKMREFASVQDFLSCPICNNENQVRTHLIDSKNSFFSFDSHPLNNFAPFKCEKCGVLFYYDPVSKGTKMFFGDDKEHAVFGEFSNYLSVSSCFSEFLKTFVIVRGIPGSGKTTVVNKIIKEFQNLELTEDKDLGNEKSLIHISIDDELGQDLNIQERTSRAHTALKKALSLAQKSVNEETVLIVVSGVLNLIEESVAPFVKIANKGSGKTSNDYGVQIVNLCNFYKTSKNLKDEDISEYRKNFEL